MTAEINTQPQGKCPQCGASNGITDIACKYCGAALQPDWEKLRDELMQAMQLKCSKCGTVNNALMEKCLWCGEPIVNPDPLVQQKRQGLYVHLIKQAKSAMERKLWMDAQRYAGQACTLMPGDPVAQQIRTTVEQQLALKEEQM